MADLLLITSVPLGDAPLWVREKWLGLTLPLAQPKAAPLTFLTTGVLSEASRGWLPCLRALLTGKLERQSGYRVEARAAVAELAKVHPEAASWWRENAAHLFRGKHYFVFNQEAGHAVNRET
jgi:hypothetical protein